MIKTIKMLEKIGGKANHFFKNTPGKLMYYMFTLFSSLFKKCDYKEHKPPRVLEIRENLILDALLRCKTCFSFKRFYGITKVAHTKNFKKCKNFKKMQKTGKNVTITVFTPNSRIKILYFFSYSFFGRFCQST